jgi:hypothetical protein
MSDHQQSKIERYLEEKRNRLTRIEPKEALEAVKQEEGTVLIDTRPESFRQAEGAIPGALIIER